MKKLKKNAFTRVSEIVEILEKFYNFSLKLEAIWPNLLEAICTEDPIESIGNQQAIIKQISELFKFVFLFDHEKIMHPSIQNDFSYYRRVYHRMKAQMKKKRKETKNLPIKCPSFLLILHL